MVSNTDAGGNSPASAFVPGSYQEAARQLINFPVVQSSIFKKIAYRASTDGAHDDILRFTRAFTKDCHARGWPIFPIEFVRDKDRQNRLNHEGRSKAAWGQSPHNFGMAVDLVHYPLYWGLSRKDWALLGLIGKECARRQKIKITWGGDWKFYDPAHWELTDWRKIRDNQKPPPGNGFSAAFADARAKGLKEFEWRGRRYTTALA